MICKNAYIVAIVGDGTFRIYASRICEIFGQTGTTNGNCGNLCKKVIMCI